MNDTEDVYSDNLTNNVDNIDNDSIVQDNHDGFLVDPGEATLPTIIRIRARMISYRSVFHLQTKEMSCLKLLKKSQKDVM